MSEWADFPRVPAGIRSAARLEGPQRLNGQRSREESGAHVCSARARACRHHAEHHFYVQANEHVVRATDDALVFTQLHTLTVLIVS